MRAKFVNEIKREVEGSGLGPINVGSVRITRFYDKMKQNWPDAINSMFSATHNTSDYMISMIYKAAEMLGCDVRQIKYIQKSGFGTDKLLDRWVEILVELSHEEPIILNGEQYNDYDDSKVKYGIVINPIPEWDLVVVTKNTLYPENTSQTNYLIKTPLR